MDATLATEAEVTAAAVGSDSLDPVDVEYLRDEYEVCADSPDWHRFPLVQDDGREILVDYDNVESADQILSESWRMLAEPEPAPDAWRAIRLRTYIDHGIEQRVAQVVYDHRPGYQRRVAREAAEHERDGYKVIWVSAPDDWTPPIGTTNRDENRKAYPAQRHARKTKAVDPLCVERNALDEMGIVVLGDSADGAIHIHSHHTRKTSKITNIDQLKHARFLQIGGPKIRRYVHQSSTEETPPGMHDMTAVRNMIALLASQRRIEPDLSYGQGFHLGETGSGIIVDAGIAALWDYDSCELTEIVEPFADGRLLDFTGAKIFDFVALKQRLVCVPDRATKAVHSLGNILSEWSWKHAGAHVLAVGLILATMIQSVWKWRPQVAITGESSSAKTLFLETLNTVFGGMAELSAKPSEAGLRQSIGNRVLPVLVDELEKSKERPKTYELIRTGSRGTKILRGTIGQKALSFGLRHIVWVASVEVGLVRQPDRNRFIRMELQPPRRWMSIPSDGVLRDLGQELFAAAVYYCHEAIEICEQLKQTTIEGVEQRRVESYAVPTAMLAVTGMLPRTPPETILRELIDSMGEQSSPEASEPDQTTLLRDILAIKIIVDRQMLTVGEILDNPSEVKDSREALERDGIKRCGQQLFLATTLIESKLRGTTWDGQAIGEILSRLPGAVSGRDARRRCGHVRHYGVLIPWDVVDQFLARDEHEQAEHEQATRQEGTVTDDF